MRIAQLWSSPAARTMQASRRPSVAGGRGAIGLIRWRGLRLRSSRVRLQHAGISDRCLGRSVRGQSPRERCVGVFTGTLVTAQRRRWRDLLTGYTQRAPVCWWSRWSAVSATVDSYALAQRPLPGEQRRIRRVEVVLDESGEHPRRAPPHGSARVPAGRPRRIARRVVGAPRG